jgi:hypothetical protein
MTYVPRPSTKDFVVSFYLIKMTSSAEQHTRLTAKKELIDAAKSLISKLALRNSTYPPDSYPNPGRYPPALCQVPA